MGFFFFNYICNIKLNKMKNKKKLSKEELDQLVLLRTEYADLRSHLCDITLAEERMKTDKQRTLININDSSAKLSEMHSSIQSKYGEGKINLQTGEIS